MHKERKKKKNLDYAREDRLYIVVSTAKVCQGGPLRTCCVWFLPMSSVWRFGSSTDVHCHPSHRYGTTGDMSDSPPKLAMHLSGSVFWSLLPVSRLQDLFLHLCPPLRLLGHVCPSLSFLFFSLASLPLAPLSLIPSPSLVPSSLSPSLVPSSPRPLLFPLLFPLSHSPPPSPRSASLFLSLLLYFPSISSCRHYATYFTPIA